MKRVRIIRFLLVTAFFHLFADMAFAGGAVLCVDLNDHTAIEVGHLVPGCDTLSDTRETGPSTEPAPVSCTNCTDTPLHAGAEMMSKRLSCDLQAPAAFVSFALPMQRLQSDRLFDPIRQGRDLSATLEPHRTTVLLI